MSGRTPAWRFVPCRGWAYNKKQDVEAAQKALNQGKVAQAIAEYQNILKYEPRRSGHLHDLGELYQSPRRNLSGHAIIFDALRRVSSATVSSRMAIALQAHRQTRNRKKSARWKTLPTSTFNRRDERGPSAFPPNGRKFI